MGLSKGDNNKAGVLGFIYFVLKRTLYTAGIVV
jgi:hypothetical protein